MTAVDGVEADDEVRKDESGGRWATSLAVSVLLLASLLPLAAVVQGSDWWITAAVAIASVLVPAGVVRSLGGAPWLGSVIGAATWVVILIVLFVPDSAILGLVPTFDTVGAVEELAVAAGQSIYVQAVPVDPVTPLLFLLAVGIGAVAVLADVLAISLRSPAFTGVLALGMLVPPSIFTGSLDLVAYLLAGIAYLAVLRTDRPAVSSIGARASTRTGALVVGASAVVVTIVAGTLVPGFSTRSVVQPDGPSSFGSGISALADLGRDLQRPGNTPHFTYQTTSTSPQYLRMLTLDRFEGTQWTSSGEHPTAAQEDGERLPVPGLTSGVAIEEATVEVAITGLVGDLLPVPFPSVAVSGLRGEWEWDTDGLTVSSRSSSVEGQEYSVTALVIEPTSDQLRGAPDDVPGEVAPYLELPDEVPEAVRRVFDEVTAGSATRYDAAYAIQQYLRTEFSYSVATPVDEGYDGDGFEAIGQFLEAGSGYCVHFASAMAILSRMAGIPARISLGYLPGDRIGSDDDGFVAYRVGSDDLHSWPELYFAGVGWVPFEPTPGRGSVPSYAFQATDAPDADDVPDPGVTRTPSATPTPTASDGAAADGAAGSRTEASGLQTAAVGVVLLLIVLGALLAPAFVRALRRRRRWAGITGGASAGDAWAEVVDSATDLGFDVRNGDTERDLAGRLRSSAGLDADAASALARVLTAREREHYAGDAEPTGDAVGLRTDVETVAAALAVSVPLSRRLRAVLAPASVLSRRGDADVRRARTP
jgi:transglutaminase-like putative cysteine protease